MALRKFNISTVLGLLTVAMLTVALATSCTSDTPTSPNQHRDVWLSFEISSLTDAARNAEGSRSLSRADVVSDTENHPEEESTDPENHIELSDMMMLLLDNNQSVIKVFDKSEITKIENTQSQQYELKARVSTDLFNYAPGEEIKLSLLLIANLNGCAKGHDFPYWLTLYGKSVTEISQLHHSFNAPDNGWMPDYEKKHFIPMSGLKHYTLSRTKLEAAVDEPYNIGENGTGDMYVMRSLAKIRILEDIKDKEKYGIKSIEIEGYCSAGAFLPDFEQTKSELIDWEKYGTCQVESATTNSDPEWFQPKKLVSLTLTEGDFTSSENKNYTQAWLAYVPEAAANTLLLRIMTKDGLTYSYLLPQMNIFQLVRNHVYEFIVSRGDPSGTTPIKPHLYVAVCPWENEVVDIPTFD